MGDLHKKLTISASDLNSCPRGVYYKKKKHPEPLVHPKIADIWQLFGKLQEMGQEIQKKVVEEWRVNGILLSPERFIPWNDYVTGKYDAIVKIDGKPVLYEIKRASKNIREAKTPQYYDEHRVQLILYYHFLKRNFPGLTARLLYYDKSTENRIEFTIDYEGKEILELLERAKKLREAIQNDILPNPVETLSLNKFTKKYDVSMAAITCKYHGLCLEDDHWYEKALEEVKK